MLRRLAEISLILAIVGCGGAPPPEPPAPGPAGTATEGSAPRGPITLNLCAGAGARDQDRAWKTPLLTSMARLLDGAPAPGDTVKLRIGACPDAFHEKTCYASPGILACREEFIARLFQSAAWGGALSAIALQRHPEPRGWYGVMAKLGGGDLFELVAAAPDAIPALASKWQAEGAWKAGEVIAAQALVERIRLFESNMAQPGSPVEQLAEAVYLTIAAHLTSFVVGHELSHYLADRCVFTEPSIVEGERRMDALRVLQEPRGLLCDAVPASGKWWPMTPRLEEVLADRCALRGMDRLERRALGKTWGQPAAGSPTAAVAFVARRLVVDILAWSLAYGPETKGREDFGDDGNRRAIRASLLPGYLYPQHRLALVASELSRYASPGGPRPLICEDTARIFALQSRGSASVCRSGQVDAVRRIEEKLPAALGDYVPQGVISLWRTGNWDQDHSFVCDPP